MADYDAIIVGGGPAGLTAGLYLCRGGWHTLLLEKERVGGFIMNVEWIENYPGYAEGVNGSQLAMEMKNQAAQYGLETQRKEVISVQLSSGNKMVSCPDGTTYTASAVIFTGGSVPKKLNVPGERELTGKGVFTCAFCDGGEFSDRVVAICGSGDSGVTEALYMANIASKVIIMEMLPKVTATAVLKERVDENPKIEARCGVKVTAITGDDEVTGLDYTVVESGQQEKLDLDGVLVHIGLDPNTGYLQGVLPLDETGHIKVSPWMETEVPGVFAAGDIRSGSPKQVSTAVGDGATAGISAQRYLQRLG